MSHTRLVEFSVGGAWQSRPEICGLNIRLVCSKQPSDPHHLRFAQPRALGLKVSDEFTVPLCRGHHRQLHQAGNEVTWWADLGIKPMETAKHLWKKRYYGADAARIRAMDHNLDQPGRSRDDQIYVTVIVMQSQERRFLLLMAIGPRSALGQFFQFGCGKFRRRVFKSLVASAPYSASQSALIAERLIWSLSVVFPNQICAQTG